MGARKGGETGTEKGVEKQGVFCDEEDWIFGRSISEDTQHKDIFKIKIRKDWFGGEKEERG